MTKRYSELILLPSFEERFEYLAVHGRVGDPTFGSSRYLNQIMYKMPRWRSARRDAIIRDNACDLAHPDFEIKEQAIYVHHINPITAEDILEERSVVFDLENLITTTFRTHQAIHYGDKNGLLLPAVERRPNDTCPWKG